LHVTARSEGIKLPDTFNFQFRPLWQMTPKEKADVAEQTTRTVLAADELGIVSRKTTLEELRQSSRETGIWATISDEDIDSAEADLPPAAELLGGAGVGGGERPAGNELQQAPGQSETGAPRPLGLRRNPVPPPTVTLRGAA
jgi:hypothetical protein